jgi:hypothetical protein
MPGWQFIDPAEQRPQQLVKGRETQVGFPLGGAQAERGVPAPDRQLHSGSQQGALADPGIPGQAHGAALLSHTVKGRLDLGEFGVPPDEVRRSRGVRRVHALIYHVSSHFRQAPAARPSAIRAGTARLTGLHARSFTSGPDPRRRRPSAGFTGRR